MIDGGYHGVFGFVRQKAKACQKAHEKYFQNLRYVERHGDDTIARPIQTFLKKIKVYLWPDLTRLDSKWHESRQNCPNHLKSDCFKELEG
ncbi:hypothetical protein R6Q59_032639 [Mikania micrantha]